MSFTLHTELRASVPEFTISCLTHGGPATAVLWSVDRSLVKDNTSQVILDTSHNSVYDNRLRVRGRRAGTYYCEIIGNSVVVHGSQTITGIILLTNDYPIIRIIL